MPSYINPAKMLGGNIDPKSPFAGALAGVEGAYATKMADQQIRDTDQGFLENLHKYETSLKDDPLKDALRAFEMEQLTSGKAQQAIDQKLETAGQTITKNRQDIMSEEAKQKGEWLADFAQYADSYLGLDPMSGRDHEIWQEKVTEAEKRGIKLPSWPDSKSMAKVQQTAAAYVNSVKNQNKIQEIKVTAQAQGDQHARPDVASSVAGQEKLNTGRFENAQEVARIRATSETEKAQIKADAIQSAKTHSAQIIDNVQKALKADIKDFGKPRETTIMAAVSAAQIGAEILLKETEGWDMTVLRGERDPTRKKIMEDKLRDMTLKYLSTMPGMTDYAAQQGGKVVSTPAPSGSSDDFEKRMEAALKRNPGKTREQIMEALQAAKEKK